MKPPVVDVIIPTLDRLEMLQEAIASIRAQSYQHWNLVVADNGSTDGTLEWLGSQGIRYVQAAVKGAGAARNAGAAATDNPWLYFLDSDDLAEPNAIEVLIEHVVRERVDLCFGYAQNVVTVAGLQLHPTNTARPAPISSTSLLSREALHRYGEFSTDNFSWAAWYLEAKDNGLTEAAIDVQICRRRIHGDNVSSETGAKSAFFDLIRHRLAQKQASRVED